MFNLILTCLIRDVTLPLCGPSAPLHGEGPVPHPHAVTPGEVRAIHLGLATQPRQDLTRPRRVSPLVVAAGIILGREAAGRPVP